MATSKPLLKTPPKASTAVAVKKNTSMVSIKETLQAQAAAMEGRTAPVGGSGIKLAPGSMTLPDGVKTPGPIELVVVDFAAQNMFYRDPFDPNNIVPPDCFAIGPNPLTLVPSPNSPDPQAKTCAECPNNAWGSKGKGKACNNERRLAVLPPSGDAETPLWTMKVATMGVKSWDSHVNGVKRTFDAPPIGVVTTVSLNPNVTYASLIFSDPVPNPEVGVHLGRQAEAQTLLAVEPDVSSWQPADAKPAPRKTVAPTRPAARR
jgi:hypothetical protein